MTDSNRLDGQAAIVTGAAQGIGKGIALVLDEAGAAIVIGGWKPSSFARNPLPPSSRTTTEPAKFAD